LAALDKEISQALSEVLHDGAFKSLESLWRGVVFLLSRIEVKSALRVYLIDIPKSELVSDLLASDDPTEWSLGGLVLGPVSEHGEELRWAGLIGAYTFGSYEEDVHLLQRIGLLAEAAEVPWFSAGDSALLGCESIETAPDPRDWTDPVDPLWSQFRGNPEASWISLLHPEFLLRSPHGIDGRGAESFDFIEWVAGSGDLLWGNPAILCGIGLAWAFAASGWGLGPPAQITIDNVPVFTTPEEMTIPVRGLLSHSGGARVHESGLSPVLASRNEAVLRVPGIRTVSSLENTVKAWWISGS
jgi:type VI secretion system protein ImpC